MAQLTLQLRNTTPNVYDFDFGTLAASGDPGHGDILAITAANSSQVAKNPALRQLLNTGSVSLETSDGSAFSGRFAYDMMDSIAGALVIVP